MLDRIEVWAVGRKVLKDVPCLINHGFGVLSFVKRCAIHHQHSSGRQFRQQIGSEPEVEHVSVDVRPCQPDCEQRSGKQCADGVDVAPGVLVLRTKTTSPTQGIAMGAGHVMGEPAFVM